MLTAVLEKEAVVGNRFQTFHSDVDFINQKLEESEKSPIQSVESTYLEGWK